jgi:hypothetical protein
MRQRRLRHIIVLGIATLVAGCSSKSGGGSPGSGGGGGGAAGASGTAGATGTGGGNAGTGGAGVGGTGGAPVQQYAPMRYMQVYLNAGAKKSYDLWAQNNDFSWVSLVKGLTYGQMTDYIQTPVIGLGTTVWFIPPGANPDDYEISIGDFIHLTVDKPPTGPHTGFMLHVPEVGDWAMQVLSDADPDLTPPAGYAYVAFNTAALREAHPTIDYGRAGSCLARATQDNYQPVAAGSNYAFALYAGDSASNCQGSVIVTAPSTTFGEGEVWMIYGFGDATNGYELRPVKMMRN